MARRILVVEDDLLNRMFLCATLEANGFDVMMVTDGARVLEAARDYRPDLITMDINLPNVSGASLIEMLKADDSFRHIPILAITAYVGKGEESYLRGVGASDYMAKPVSIRPFVASVNRLLERPTDADGNGTPVAEA